MPSMLNLSCLHQPVNDAGRHILIYLYLFVTGFHAAVIETVVIKPAQPEEACDAA